MSGTPDPRLILRDEELDAGLELLLLCESTLWAAADTALEPEAKGLGRSHYRTLFLLKRRPGLGVRELARLTALSKQGASRTLAELTRLGLVEKGSGEADARRKPARLTREGAAVEARVSERLRSLLARAYRTGGLDAVAGARRILSALAGGRLAIGRPEPEL
ncbi:MAG TPA: helix-turn-helix domain-containing protein [Caulobacteraceae bacterium]